jgi:hypothetical protein
MKSIVSAVGVNFKHSHSKRNTYQQKQYLIPALIHAAAKLLKLDIKPKKYRVLSKDAKSCFYYTDGLDLRPYALSGTFTILEASDKAKRGSFDVGFENNFNDVSGKRVTGDFGIINKFQ